MAPRVCKPIRMNKKNSIKIAQRLPCSGKPTLFCLTELNHSANMFEYANDASATGEIKNIGTCVKPWLSKLADKHSNKSYTTPDG